MRHSPVLISEVIQMRIDGFTLGEITSKTGLSKTTIFHHIKFIPKSDTLKKKIRTISQILQKKQADFRRGKSVKNYIFKKPKKWTPNFVNLVSHFLFDGRITHATCLYYNRNKILIDNIIFQMKNILNIDDYKIYQDRNNVTRLAYHNVEVALFIRQKADELLKYIISGSRQEKISFLQSFFDDEGCVDFKITKNRRGVRGYQHSLSILNIVRRLLEDVGIRGVVDKKYFEIVISKKENLVKFQKLINFTAGVTVNGARSNSIWKKSLEKREILKMAVDSYLI